jgi:hypothetical protein
MLTVAIGVPHSAAAACAMRSNAPVGGGVEDLVAAHRSQAGGIGEGFSGGNGPTSATPLRRGGGSAEVASRGGDYGGGQAVGERGGVLLAEHIGVGAGAGYPGCPSLFRVGGGVHAGHGELLRQATHGWPTRRRHGAPKPPDANSPRALPPDAPPARPPNPPLSPTTRKNSPATLSPPAAPSPTCSVSLAARCTAHEPRPSRQLPAKIQRRRPLKVTGSWSASSPVGAAACPLRVPRTGQFTNGATRPRCSFCSWRPRTRRHCG